MARLPKSSVHAEPPRRITQAEIARRCDVSRVAVAVVLGEGIRATTRVGEKTADKIRRVAKQLGYRPNLVARQLAGGRSGIVGMLVHQAVANYDHVRIGRLVTSIEAAAYEQGQRLFVGQYRDPDHLRSYAEDFADRGVDGLLCVSHELEGLPRETVPEIVSRQARVVFLNRPAGLADPWFVQIDYAAGVIAAVKHLLGQGRKKIGEIYFSLDYSPMERRHLGAVSALQAAGHSLASSRVWIGPGSVEPTPDLLNDAIDCVIVAGKADAVLLSNDRWAAELIKLLKKRKIRVPEDVAVVGYNNQDLCLYGEPTLTSIDLADAQVGAAMVNMMHARLAGDAEESPREVTVPTELVIRESTGGASLDTKII